MLIAIGGMIMTERGMTFADMGDLHVVDGKLHWKGQAIVVDQKLSLRRYELILATGGALGALLAGVHPFLVSLGWL
jgi:hypothetical protein